MIWKPHVTVAAVVEENDKFLLVQENINNELVFNQPAGHLEPDETLQQAVQREVLEEAGMFFTPEFITGIYLFTPKADDITYLRICFSGSCSKPDVPVELDAGIAQVKWMGIEEINSVSEQLRTPLVRQCIDDYLSGMRQSLDILRESYDQ